jgi:hypothetical protein
MKSRYPIFREQPNRRARNYHVQCVECTLGAMNANGRTKFVRVFRSQSGYDDHLRDYHRKDPSSVAPQAAEDRR